VAKVTGAKAHAARLKRLTGPESVRLIGRALFVGGDLLKATAQQSITEGAVSGKGHVASAPGEAPNNDTGDLANNIENVQTGPLSVEVSSNSRHALPLERGTSKMEARPSMGPAAHKTRPEIVRIVTSAVKRVVQTSGGGA
jgi:HK97 gp10 family phage protein